MLCKDLPFILLTLFLTEDCCLNCWSWYFPSGDLPVACPLSYDPSDPVTCWSFLVFYYRGPWTLESQAGIENKIYSVPKLWLAPWNFFLIYFIIEIISDSSKVARILREFLTLYTDIFQMWLFTMFVLLEISLSCLLSPLPFPLLYFPWIL